MKRAIFVRIPKTGSSSVTDIINPYSNIFQNRRDNIIGEFSKDWIDIGLMKLITDKIGESKIRKYFSFAFVRNPYDRAVSSWMHSNRRREGSKLSFSQYLNLLSDSALDDQDIWHATPQYRHLVGYDGRTSICYIGRFEKLVDDLERVLRELGIVQFKLKNLNRSDRGYYKDYYDSEAKGIVRKLYQEDLDRLNYEY